MFKNYLKVAFRNIRRQKGYAFINVAGLTLGMACCMIIFQYVAHEYSFDHFNTKKDLIYRAMIKTAPVGGDGPIGVTTGFILGPTVVEEVPEVVRYARIIPNFNGAVLSYKGPAGERTFTEENAYFVDSTFLSMFDYPLVRGSREQALRRPQTMLVSESLAQKYFGDENPIGKVIDFNSSVNGSYTVTGIFKDMPSTSHIQFDAMLPIQDVLNSPQYLQDGAGWDWQNFITYLETAANADVEIVERKITESYYRHKGDQLSASKLVAEAHLQPLLDIHLNADIQAPFGTTGDRKTVHFFAIIGLVTLLIALVNYINLSTARALDRAKEVGVRKVMGAQQHQLMGQFLAESALTNFLALVLAIGLSLAVLPMVNRLAETSLAGALWLDGRFWAVFLGIFGLSALLSGLYPAFILSSFKPVTVLKGKAGAFASRVGLRKVLVAVQFAASIVLLAGTVVVYSQLRYMREMDTGLSLDQVLVIEGPRIRPEGMDPATSMNTLKNELQGIPEVKDVALSVRVPGRGFSWHTQFYRLADDPETAKDGRATGIDENFNNVYGLTLVAGRSFREGIPVSPESTPVLVNETFVKTLGFPTNEAAVGEGIHVSGGGRAYFIEGVLKDFNWSSAHQATENIMLFYAPTSRTVSMQVSTTDLPATLAAIQQRYEALFPGNPFEYYFADESFDEQYASDERFATLFGVFAGLAILIACLGLFGLAAFTAKQRTEEIGMRKVLGASVASIVALLSKDFLKLVLIACIIAVPVAWYFMSRWLEGFAYRIELGPGVFLLAGMVAVLIALATVSYQSIKAATADPVKSLRYE